MKSKHNPKLLSQFYTKDNIAKRCLSNIDVSKYNIIIEPSAGTGSFSKQITHNNILSIDIDPRFEDCNKMDFFDFTTTEKNILVIGNPPFGKNSSMAIKFFNHASNFADTIAFIVPRTFRKNSILKRLNKRFHLVHETILPLDSFILECNTEKSVPTCGQIGEKRDYCRKMETEYTTINDGEGTTNDNANFAIRRVGVNAGKIIDVSKAAIASHYFIRANDDVKNLLKKIEGTKCSAKYDVAGNPSITKSDIIKEYLFIKSKQ